MPERGEDPQFDVRQMADRAQRQRTDALGAAPAFEDHQQGGPAPGGRRGGSSQHDQVRALDDGQLLVDLKARCPDDSLIDVAARNALHDPAELERQVRRMLADRRASALVDNFAAQLNLLTANPLDVEQSVDQSRKVLHLPLDQIEHFGG